MGGVQHVTCGAWKHVRLLNSFGTDVTQMLQILSVHACDLD